MQLYHLNKCIRVTRISEQELKAECTVLSTEQEAVACIVTDIEGLLIKNASWARYRSPEGVILNQEFPQLVGIEAYLNSGYQLKKLLVDKDQEFAHELLAECINGMVQSETFFFKERGYASMDAFLSYWDGMYINSCRRFSHPDPKDRFKDKIGHLDRSPHLFERIHNVTIYQEPDNSYLILTTFNDSHHEVSVRLGAGKDGMVRSVSGEFIRAPYEICKETVCNLEKLVGLSIAGMSKKAIAALVGGPEGCQHIFETVYDCCQALEVVIQRAALNSCADSRQKCIPLTH